MWNTRRKSLRPSLTNNNINQSWLAESLPELFYMHAFSSLPYYMDFGFNVHIQFSYLSSHVL